MLKKMTAFFLLMAFSNVYAFTPIQQTRAIENELNKTFDSLNYRLNVEWDQKDSKFFDATIADFEKEIGALQKAGLTKEELVKYTMGKIKDKDVKNEINELSKVIGQSKMTNEEARAFTISKLNSTYSHGASWSGSRVGAHAAVLVGIIIILIIVAHHDDYNDDNVPVDECYQPEYPQYPTYDTVSSCYTECCPVY